MVTREVQSAIYGADIAPLRPAELNHSCIVLWGHNPKESYTPEYQASKDIKKKGHTKFIVIDSKRTEIVDELANIWLPIRPGTDAALALGWLNVIINEGLYDKEFVEKWCYGFDRLRDRVKQYPPKNVSEITWVPEEKIIESARMYAMSKPYTAIPWGVRTDMQGKNVTSVLHATSILRAITGSLNVKGGSLLSGPCQMANGGADFNNIDMLSPEQRRKQLGADRFKLWTLPGYELISQAMKPYRNGKVPSSRSLPKKEFMERAREIWEEERLPKLNPKVPWYGYTSKEGGKQ